MAVPFFLASCSAMSQRSSTSYDLPLILTAFVLGFGALMWLKIDPTQELIPEDHALLAKA